MPMLSLRESYGIIGRCPFAIVCLTFSASKPWYGFLKVCHRALTFSASRSWGRVETTAAAGESLSRKAKQSSRYHSQGHGEDFLFIITTFRSLLYFFYSPTRSTVKTTFYDFSDAPIKIARSYRFAPSWRWEIFIKSRAGTKRKPKDCRVVARSLLVWIIQERRSWHGTLDDVVSLSVFNFLFLLA